MYNREAKEIYVVIVAGGKGTRMGMALPKQFLLLNGKPVLYHTLVAFIKTLPNARFRLVLPEDDISKLNMVLQHIEERIDLEIFSGGENRFESVRNGIANLPDNALVLVHDGVRPFVSETLIRQCISEAEIYGSAIPCLAVTDSIRSVEGDHPKPIDRTYLRSIQTPQAFRSELLIPAFRQDHRDSFTDEASVVEQTGVQIHLIKGERFNIKITTPEDLILAESIANQVLK